MSLYDHTSATKKGRCRLHGGTSGSGGPPGERNGQYRHGERTKAAIAERQRLAGLICGHEQPLAVSQAGAVKLALLWIWFVPGELVLGDAALSFAFEIGENAFELVGRYSSEIERHASSRLLTMPSRPIRHA